MSITANRIKELRKQKKLTQSELAKKINASRMAIANYETDRNNPSYAMLSLIADALNTTVEYLQGKTDSPLKTPAVDDNGDDKKHVDLADDELIMSFEGKELSEDYKQAIIAMLKTMREGKQ
ncbi:helix-turn-helix domain-containing protein [Leuconostoc mesenteroides]|uniref:helix-turn-helix domain-containing protein n=1 Tax=Leuconostoc mesenteroides TaxID=1245 RepID=UPI0009FFA30D|nr:helix-turn-helix transcriptional regulator [Leuconostoc mesenteroides]ORI46686.1 transcriptional regulator [Leuconostoc mesenteroides subsp. cremoris]ORI48129.1 transcriptional regulator [Leuconostoc mesenteroides subsp. cremoris]ORI50906.1 transcriptional regulator [Leuconostoc mesenteroides subsp. cremoris]ORI56543.1 transcriptional regulator [Leuconostoc mesenteroides subsp. cremoris]ORI58735.1 transcriptional regulator [Leuconostoc mesenteroides subsp. cremoris]